MGERRNCWEFLHCGREPGGAKAEELGICPATLREDLDGINHGSMAGRVCWTIPDTRCGGVVIKKFKKCLECDFFQAVEREEGRYFTLRLGHPPDC